MAGVAGDLARPSKIRLVDRVHHHHHPPRRILQRRIVGIPRPTPPALRRVAIGAVQAQRGGKKTHGPQKLVHRNAPQHLDVLERILRHLRLLFLPARPSRAQQAHRYRGYCTTDRSTRSEFHVPSLFTLLVSGSLAVPNAGMTALPTALGLYRIHLPRFFRLCRPPLYTCPP